MTRAAPVRLVVATRIGPACETVTFPNGETMAIVCHPRPIVDTLECGHVVRNFGGRRVSRRCGQCAELELEQATGQARILDVDGDPIHW